MNDDSDFEDVKAPPGFSYPTKKKEKKKTSHYWQPPADTSTVEIVDDDDDEEAVIISKDEKKKKTKKETGNKESEKKKKKEGTEERGHHHHHHHQEEEIVDDGDIVGGEEDNKESKKKKHQHKDKDDDTMDDEIDDEKKKKQKGKDKKLVPGQSLLESFFLPASAKMTETPKPSSHKTDVEKPDEGSRREQQKKEEKSIQEKKEGKPAQRKELKEEDLKEKKAIQPKEQIFEEESVENRKPKMEEKSLSPNQELKPVETKEPKKEEKSIRSEEPKKEVKSKTVVHNNPVKRAQPDPDKEEKKEEEPVKKKRFFFNGPMDRSALNPHSKPLPEGKMNCLAGKVFTITGRLDSLDRDEATELIRKYGGAVQQQAGVKVTHVLVGVDGGESKLKAAKERNLKTLNEDELFEMIKTLPAQPSSAVIRSPVRRKNAASSTSGSTNSVPATVVVAKPKQACVVVNRNTAGGKSSVVVPGTGSLSNPLKLRMIERKDIMEKENGCGNQMMWVDKYAPLEMQDMILGNRDPINKMTQWLRSWKTQSHQGNPSKTGRDAALLLSGPPGIGKTTSARVVCKELGFTIIELNASDTRCKSLLRETVQEAISSSSISSYFAADGAKTKSSGSVLVMDEVDGMSAGDRGGISELIELIKSSPKIPIICICNDRKNQKIRTLATHCTDVKFLPPTPDQISPLLYAIAQAEGFKDDVVNMDKARRIAVSADCDLRQSIHLLQMTCVGSKTSSTTNNDGQPQKMKDLDINPFEVVPKLFTYLGSTLDQKFRYCFSDYKMVPLLISENYISTKPRLAGTPGSKGGLSHIDLIAASAEDISASDVLEADIRRDGRWELLNEQMLLGCIKPCFRTQGALLTRGGTAGFPTFLGKYSSGSKNSRLMSEISSHIRAETASAGSFDIASDYLPLLFERVTKPIVTDGAAGIDDVISFMNEYNLTREDWDTITELSVSSMAPKRSLEIPPTVRAAFTRKYNAQNGTVLPGQKASKDSAVRVSESERQGIADFELGREAEAPESLDDDDDEDDDIPTSPSVSPVKRKRSSTSKKDGKDGANKPSKTRRRTSKE